VLGAAATLNHNRAATHGAPNGNPKEDKQVSNSSKYRFLSLAVIAAMSIALAACGGDTGGGASATMSNADLLKAAATNMKNAKSYHLDLSGTAAGQTISMNGDIDVAGNKSNLTIAAAGMNISAVTIVSDTYLSTDGGKTFTKTDPSSNPVSGLGSFTKMWDSFKPADIDKAASALKDASPANDTIDGATTKHITANAQDLSSLSSAAGSGGVMTGTIDIWVSTDTNPTVRQMKVNGTSSGQAINFNMKWSNINQPVTITAPPASSGGGSAPAAVPTTDTSGGSGTGGTADMTPTPGQ
jgi:LppX_LprAFG lipoprotein